MSRFSPLGSSREIHNPETLMSLFDALFDEAYQTRLILGGQEPLYLPKDERYGYHRVVFSHDYFASALHEVAHWCIAGAERRRQVDYGYWYKPDGRSGAEQSEFEAVEYKPQALEWIFAKAAGFKFRVSADNLNGGSLKLDDFKLKIYEQVGTYLERGLPARGRQFADALAVHYGEPQYCEYSSYSLDEL